MATSVKSWFTSEELDTRVYLRVTTYQSSDGLLRREFDVLGLVYLDPITGNYTARVKNEEYTGFFSAKLAKDHVESIAK